MLNKKQMLALMLSAAAATQAYSIDVAELKQTIATQFSDKMKELKPAVANFTGMVQKGNFDGIASKLTINLTPAVQFLINNMDIIKANLDKYLIILASQAPQEYKAQAESTLALVKEKLENLDSLKSHLEEVKQYVDLSKYRDTIATALEKASESAEFSKLKDNLKASGKTLQDLIDKAKSIDTGKIEKSLNKIPELYTAYQSGQDISILDIAKTAAPGIGELRNKLLPIAPAIAAELSATAIEISNLLKKISSEYQLPGALHTALEQINEIGNQIFEAFKTLNPKIDELKKSLL